MRRDKALVAIRDSEIRNRIVSALRQAANMEVEAVAGLEDAAASAEGGYLLFSQRDFARESDRETTLLLSLRLRRTVLVVYDSATLLEASSVFDAVDGWVPADGPAELLPAHLRLARERYAVLPRVPDQALGLDSIRRERFGTLDPMARHVLSRVATGETNAQIARRAHLSEEQVAGSLRRSLRLLCLERRLQAAVFMARMEGAGGSPH